MKTYTYVNVTLENKKTATSASTAHRAIIDEKAAAGYTFAGYVPCVFGPSGKMLSMDLVFSKDN